MPTIVGFVDSSRGRGLPEGGKAGQFLKKKTDSDFDCEWGDGGSAPSDNPENLNVTINQNIISSGRITAYRIGHMVMINAVQLNVNPKGVMPPFIKLCTIDKISGLTFNDSVSVFNIFNFGDGKYDGYGLVTAASDEYEHNLSIAIITNEKATLYGVNFQIIIPLTDD